MVRCGGVRFGRVSVPWRGVECSGAIVALYLQTGATGPRGNLFLPLAYTITLALLVNNSSKTLRTIRKTPLLILLVAIPFVSAIWSASASLTLYRAFTLACSMALAYLLAVRFTPPQLLVVVAIAFFPALAASLVVLGITPSTAIMPDGTVSGVFAHKNLLGWHAAVALIAGLIATHQAILPLRTGVVIVATSAVCLVASGSTTSIISAISAFILMLVFSVFRRLRGPGQIVFLALVVQVAALLLFFLQASDSSFQAFGKDSTLTGRVSLWYYIDRAILERPLLGYGYFSFWSDGSGPGWKIRSEINWNTPSAHNGFREILLAFGLFGFIPFMCMLVGALWRGACLHSLALDRRWLGVNVLMGMFVVMNTTESIFYVPQSSLFIVFVAAVLMVGVQGPDSIASRRAMYARSS